MLEVEGLSKRFGGLQAVDACSFTVHGGTITGLIGPNGAGKTTVFNLLTGFVRPDRGKVLFHGEEITGLPPYRVFRKGIARTFQIPRELKNMSLLENLMLVPWRQLGESVHNAFLHPRRVAAQERAIRTKSLNVLEFLGLAQLAAEPAQSLSGGQKKLLELGKTLMSEPQLVLLDEPGAGVNRTLLKEIAAAIERVSGELGTTFLLIEHDMDFVMRLCDPVIVMSEGRKLVEGGPAEVQRNAAVLEAYLGGQYAAVEG